MPGPLVAGIAGSIGSAVIQGSAAKKAGAAQSAAADAQIEETRRQFDMVQGLLRPYVDAGTTGLRGVMDLLGLGGTSGAGPAIEEVTTGATAGTEGYWRNPRGDRGDRRFIEGTPGNLGTTVYKTGGREFATRAEAEAYSAANATGAVTAEQAQQNAISGLANGAQFKELVKQGEYGILADQSATGGLRGGDTMGAMAQFRPAMLQSLIDKQLAAYGGLASNGQNAAAMTGTAAQNAGAQVNQALGDRGAAQAGSALAGGQAWANAGAGIINTIGGLAQPTTPGGGAWQRWTF